MPTNDDTPTIEAILDNYLAAAYVFEQIVSEKTEAIGGQMEEAHAIAKAAIQNLIDRARLDETLECLELSGGMNMGIKDRIKALEAKIKERE